MEATEQFTIIIRLFTTSATRLAYCTYGDLKNFVGSS